MKYVQINAYSGGWADSIIFKKHRELIANGDASWVFWGRGNHVQDGHMQKIATYPEVCLDALQTRFDGKAGFHSKGITRRLLGKLDEIDPDVVHLHILIGYYLNIEMLFRWLAGHRCKVVWTLHDCWAFTGHCLFFKYAHCEQWLSGCAMCSPCPQKGTYPETIFGGDASVRWSYERKRQLFTRLPPDRVQLITPSQWLADLVGQSFLSKYDVKVCHNPVNLDVFKPSPSSFRARYGIGDRFMVLGVASKWSERKGLQLFERLAKGLDPNRFATVVVGLTRKQVKAVERQATNIIALPKTESQTQLAEIYTAADVLVNPSVEETFGMNVAEAAACGTPSIVVEGSACAEVADPRTSFVVSGRSDAIQSAINDIAAMKNAEDIH